MNKVIIFKGLLLGSISIMLVQPFVHATEINKEISVKAKKGFLKKFDNNEDGNVSKEEFKHAVEKRFQSIDIDQNGTVSTQEVEDYHQKRKEKYKKNKFAKFDDNGDNLITKEEFLAIHLKRLEEKFSKLDQNNDSKLTRNEFPPKKK